MEKVNGLVSQTMERINASIGNRKPAYLASILVDAL